MSLSETDLRWRVLKISPLGERRKKKGSPRRLFECYFICLIYSAYYLQGVKKLKKFTTFEIYLKAD